MDHRSECEIFMRIHKRKPLWPQVKQKALRYDIKRKIHKRKINQLKCKTFAVPKNEKTSYRMGEKIFK